MPRPAFVHIQKAPSLVEQVALQLSKMFTEGGGLVGDRLLSERNLAAQLGVSRNVLREAIKCLETQGLLEIRQGHGTHVVHKLHKPITAALNLLVPEEKQRMQQLFEVRRIIEPESARLAALQASKKQVLQIKAAQKKLQQADTVEAAVIADTEFHRSIANATGNQILILVIESLSALLAEGQRIGFQTIDHTQPIPRHQEVLDAIERGDGDAAAQAMAAHIEEARLIFVRSAKRMRK
ncbi:MAG: FadR/GntR family transcriptional regulator [Verrucomicrobiota bacterium]